MAKTLKPGKITEERCSWVGKKIKCTNCNGEFKLEEGDQVKTEEHGFSMECPTPNCGTKIKFGPWRQMKLPSIERTLVYYP